MRALRRIAAEAIGTGWLLAAVVGSGIMAERLSGNNVGLALLANAIATGAALYGLIVIFAPVSGAHFNPTVTLVAAARRQMSVPEASAFIAAQLVGAIAGVWLAHAMFDLPLLQTGTHARNGFGQLLSETVATAGLILTILGTSRSPGAAAPAVALYVTAAYWFTASTSFANPAVTVARAFSDTFAGIAPADTPGFIAAQLVGAAVALLLGNWMFAAHDARPPPSSPT